MLDPNTRLDTERLTLRPFTEQDRYGVFDLVRDEAMARFTPDEAWRSLADADEFLRMARWLYAQTSPPAGCSRRSACERPARSAGCPTSSPASTGRSSAR